MPFSRTFRSVLLAATCVTAALVAPSLASADDSAPAADATRANDPQVARLLAAKGTLKWNHGTSSRYGHAEALVGSSANDLARAALDYNHYKDIHPKFSTARVVGKEAGKTDVYMKYPVKIGPVKIELHEVMRFVRAIRALFHLRREHLSAASAALRAEHERRVSQLGVATRVGKERLQALLHLQATPISHTVSGIMASLLLDRAALACAAVIALVLSGLAAFLWKPPAVLGVGAVLLTWLLVHRHLSKRRKVDPTTTLMERAAQLSRLFPAAFVVMGHTHVPTARPAGDATYINLGSWAEEEPLPDADPMAAPERAARTHAVIHVSDDGAKAELRTWDSGTAHPLVRP